MTQNSTNDSHSETYKALRTGYYHLLEKLYEKLLPDSPEQKPASQKEIILLIEDETGDNEQGHEVREALRSDLKHLGDQLREEGAETREAWLHEWRDIESDWAAKLLAIADKTDVELAAWREEAERHAPREWTAGKFSSPKQLTCIDCGTTNHHREFGAIRPCTHCGGQNFRHG